MISYDLETCLMTKGKKRKDVLILSLGAVDVFDPKRTFHCYVNPLRSCKTTFHRDLEEHGARMKPTETVLKNIRWRHDKAFMPEEALSRLNHFIKQTKPVLEVPVLVAHNGRSFDHKILRSAYERAEMQLPDIRYLDSLHDITRKTFKAERCHKLSVLHSLLCPDSDLKPQWHEALDDAQALSEIVTASALELVARHPSQAWYYAGKQSKLVEKVNKENGLKIDPRKKLCKRSIGIWPGVVSRGKKSKSFQHFALHFAMTVFWLECLK